MEIAELASGTRRRAWNARKSFRATNWSAAKSGKTVHKVKHKDVAKDQPRLPLRHPGDFFSAHQLQFPTDTVGMALPAMACLLKSH